MWKSYILKINILKKWKKMSRDIIILHKCTIHDNHMMYCFWDMERNLHNFLSFCTIFCPFTPLTNQKIPLTTQKIKTLKKWKKTPGDIIILHMSTKNFGHMMYSSWDTVHDGWLDRLTDGRTDGLKKWHIEVGAPPNNIKARKRNKEK